MTPLVPAPSKAPSGPVWFRYAYAGAVRTDARGEQWQVERVSAGGRVIEWTSMRDGRAARTEAMPTHPEYPTDKQIKVAEREARLAAKAARAAALRFGVP